MTPRKAKYILPLWFYFGLYVVVILGALSLFAGFAGTSFSALRKDEDRESRLRLLRTTAAVVETLGVDKLGDERCRELGGKIGIRLLILSRGGEVRCDSDLADDAVMAKLLDSLDEASSKTAEKALHHEGQHYIAVRLEGGQGGADKMGLVVPEHKRAEFIRHPLLRFAALGLLVIALLAGLSLLFYRRIAQPLREMRRGAQRYARGRFDRELPEYSISEISGLAREMNRMGRQLKHLEQVRRDFVANVSHELKTPITSIKGFVETLLEGAMEDKDDLLRFLKIISRQGERLTAIIEDLLTLARLESEERDDLLLLQEHSLKAVIESAVDICRSQAIAKDIALEVNCAPHATAILDRSLIEQALMNLIDNAVKYSGSNETVTVTASKTPTSINLTVSDHGPGIPEEHLPRLFERFYRVDKARSRNQGGTGLGLAIVKHVATIHQGTVSVESRQGQGTRFTISLPAE